ncbi:hypothetical protein MCEMSE6_02910 [Oxalobacteraceae bacterium]
MTANDDKESAYLSYVSNQKKFHKKKFIYLLKGGD